MRRAAWSAVMAVPPLMVLWLIVFDPAHIGVPMRVVAAVSAFVPMTLMAVLHVLDVGLDDEEEWERRKPLVLPVRPFRSER